jgi:hypothetical protein
MNRPRQFRIPAVILGLAVVALARAGVASENASGGPFPKDPCALFKPAEIQAAPAPNANIGRGVPTTNTAPSRSAVATLGDPAPLSGASLLSWSWSLTHPKPGRA